MATNKTILTRINTVSLTKQVTQTMKMVAASSLEKKKKQSIAIEAYYSSLQALVKDCLPILPQIASPYTDHRPIKKVLLIAVTPDKGLCGSFVSSLLGGMLDHYNRLEEEGKTVVLLPIGNKGVTFCQNRKLPFVGTYQCVEKSSLVETVDRLSNFLHTSFTHQEYDEVSVLYQSHAVGAHRNNVAIMPLLPIVTSPRDPLTQPNLICEPSTSAVYAAVMPQIIRAKLAHAIAVSQFTEQRARLMAMHQATDNAESLLKELKHLYNRTRQANITTEINEINAGSASMK